MSSEFRHSPPGEPPVPGDGVPGDGGAQAGGTQAGPSGPDGAPVRSAGPVPQSRIDARRAASRRVHRRAFIGLAVAGGALGAAAVAVAADAHGHPETAAPRPPAAPARDSRPPAPAAVVNTRLADGVTIPVNPAIVAENAKTGDAWWVTTPQQAGDIEGYADQASASVGDTVTLFVSTKATSFHVEAYRMGYYQGIGGRLVWQSDEVGGTRQALPTVTPPTNTIVCNWDPTITVPIGPTWPPGAYLLKLVGSGGEQQFVPLCVRDDTSRAAVVIQSSITTWQAYNRWGGYSLYYGNSGGALSFTHAPGGGSFANRARIVSFDRPYDHDWASGAADFVGNELPVISHAERLGLDVTYWTDVDLHARPQLLSNHRALLSLGHDEYWSLEMRDGAQQALLSGVNLAFLGANACYRQIRMGPSSLGANRLQTCYKSAAEDPMTGVDNALVTVNWPQPPVSRPESELIGSTYQDVGANADMVVSDAGSWLFAGSGLVQGQHLTRLVQGEFDRYVPGAPGPTNVDVVAHSLVANRGGNYSDVTWYTVPGGGGVFASGNASWVGALSDLPLVPGNVLPDPVPGVTDPLLRVMENLYAVVALGPASLTNPSQGTGETVYGAGGAAIRTPVPSNTA